MDNELYWIWLTTLSGITGNDITALLEQLGGIKEIYDENKFDGIVNIKSIAKLRLKDKNLKKAKAIYDAVKENGARVITYDSIDYPDVLRFIDRPPYVLYLKGEVPNWDRLLMIGVVGTRDVTDYGTAATKKICSVLAENGITVVSGMARGVDAIAARSAIDSGGKTVAVLGCGIDIAYPAENKELMEDIAKNGAVITEYPPGTQPAGRNFPERNRIISGLSKGIVVTEAPRKSGALITAHLAVEYGKDLFSVPGSIFKESCEGTNFLLSHYAKAVTSAEDILTEYTYELERLKIEKPQNNVFTAVLKNDVKKKDKINNEIKLSVEDKKYQALSEEEKAIIALLLERNMNIDDIKRKSDIEMARLPKILSMLEFGGYINKLPGNNYKLNI